MTLTVIGKQLTVTDAQRMLVRRRVDKLARVLNHAALTAQAAVSRERGMYICELTVHTRGDHDLHGRGRDRLFAAAVTAAADRVGAQAARLAGRWKSRRKGDQA